ncbi:MAG TPA: type II toxin-antitoxin system death-on-curing family toxin [Isosphaeraceae bacterium]|nr:type II toxin-antitoxin system death-on-curing family toxin [Isosphaeraceae bacterium]
MRYLDVESVVRIYLRIMESTGGSAGIRDVALLESAIAQPRMSFDGVDLYPSLEEKAAALAFALGKNHAFVDGNKRIALAASDALLRINGFKLSGTDDELEGVFVQLAAGELGRESLTAWVRNHVVPRKD